MERIKYEFIYFTKVEDKPKTSVWECKSNRSNDCLGVVKWYSPWRQYCFSPAVLTIFNVGCLEDINHFMSEL